MTNPNRRRAAGILIEQDHIALIYHVFSDGGCCYEFPGGGVEAGEDLPAAVRRELLEELGVEVAVQNLVATISYKGQMQYFYRCVITGGVFGTGRGPEFTCAEFRQFTPVWVPLVELSTLPVRPAILNTYLIASNQDGWREFRHFTERE